VKITAFQVLSLFTIDLLLNITLVDNDEEDGGAGGNSNAETVIDLVDAHRLKEINLDKKSWTAYIKGI
jgi:hypothetical protein